MEQQQEQQGAADMLLSPLRQPAPLPPPLNQRKRSLETTSAQEHQQQSNIMSDEAVLSDPAAAPPASNRARHSPQAGWVVHPPSTLGFDSSVPRPVNSAASALADAASLGLALPVQLSRHGTDQSVASSHTAASSSLLSHSSASSEMSVSPFNSPPLHPNQSGLANGVVGATSSESAAAAAQKASSLQQAAPIRGVLSPDDESVVSPDVEQHEPFYLPLSRSGSLALQGAPGSGFGEALSQLRRAGQPSATPARPLSAPPGPSPDHPLFADVHGAAAQGVEQDAEPCEVPDCHFFLPHGEYDAHMLLHHFDLVKSQRAQPQASGERTGAAMQTPATGDVVPCDMEGCNAVIGIADYTAHRRQHELSALNPFSVMHGNRKYVPLSMPTSRGGGSDGAAAGRDQPAAAPRSSTIDRPDASADPASASPSPSGPAVDTHYVSGLIPLLYSLFSRRPELQVYLCNPVQFYFRSRGDGGFGCGYKNIQTLCSALMQFPLFREALFEGMYSEKASAAARSDAAALVLNTPALATENPAPVYDADGKKENFSPLESQQKHNAPPRGGNGIRNRRERHASSAAAHSSDVPVPASSASSACPILASALRTTPELLVRMPPISVLQRLIDRAHQLGFDVVGAAQVGQLRHSKTWIGAVEAHALFCSYGLRSELIDFKSSCVGLMEYVWNYFTTRTMPVRHSSGNEGHEEILSPEQGPAKKNHLDSLYNTHAEHFEAPPGETARAAEAAARAASEEPAPVCAAGIQPNASFVPPLYFQHQGHSRTIIGIVKDLRCSGRFHLLVLDPDMSGGGVRLLQQLQRSDAPEVVRAALKTLYRNEDSLRAKEYQMVMIASHGLMTPQEQERSKRPFSTVISAVDPEDDREKRTRNKSGAEKPQGAAAEQQKAQVAGPHHERGAGDGGDGHDRTTHEHKESGQWKLERRAVDAHAPARMVYKRAGDAQGSSSSSGSDQDDTPDASRSQNNQHAPSRNNDAGGGDEHAQGEESPSQSSEAESVGTEGRDEQAKIRRENQRSELRASKHQHEHRQHDPPAKQQQGDTVAAGLASPPIGAPYCETKGIPLVPPLRHRHHAHHHHHHHGDKHHTQTSAMMLPAASDLMQRSLSAMPVLQSIDPSTAAAEAAPSESANTRLVDARAAAPSAPIKEAAVPPKHAKPRTAKNIAETSN